MATNGRTTRASPLARRAESGNVLLAPDVAAGESESWSPPPADDLVRVKEAYDRG